MEHSSNTNSLEIFYVYRSLHSDESWGAVIIGSHTRLPNCDFLMQVHAANEREAIIRGKLLYEKVHKLDSKRDDIKRFVAATLKSVTAAMCPNTSSLYSLSDDHINIIAKISMKLAVAMDKEYENYFESLAK